MCIITKALKISKTSLCHNKFIHPRLSDRCQVLVLLMVACHPEVPIHESKSSWNLHLLPVLVEDMAAGDPWPSGCWDICHQPPWPRLGLSRVRKWMDGRLVATGLSSISHSQQPPAHLWVSLFSWPRTRHIHLLSLHPCSHMWKVFSFFPSPMLAHPFHVSRCKIGDNLATSAELKH